MHKTWNLLPQLLDDPLEQLFLNRKLKTLKEREGFLSPNLDDFEKELQIPGIEKTQKRILTAIEKKELIIVYGDYDVDGVCASAILYKALSTLGAKVLPYIPHREKEGYGLSNLGLEFARDSGATVVITVDNGIVALEQADYAKKIGLDLIITDHHLPLEKLPDAYSIVHSTKMCGAGVAWCLVRSLISKSLAEDLLQFVGIATICDMIPLVGIGRAFVKRGLGVLSKTNNLGLIELSIQCGFDLKHVTSYEIGHIIGPRLNAIGRLEHAIDALRLLCTKDSEKAKNLARLLCDANVTRQKMTVDALEEARLKIDKTKKIHILDSKEWAQGIIGLIAGRIAEEHMRPAIAISVGETFSKGSARSVNGLNIVEVIRSCSDVLIDVGGHPGAAGFSILNEHIEIFKTRIEKLVETLPDDVQRVIDIDAKCESQDISKKLIKDLEKLEPFGFGNPKPLFVTFGMKASDVRTVGSGKHLKFKADNIDAIAFGMGDLEKDLRSSNLVDVVYSLEIDNYNGFEKIQLKVKDIKLS